MGETNLGTQPNDFVGQPSSIEPAPPIKNGVNFDNPAPGSFGGGSESLDSYEGDSSLEQKDPQLQTIISKGTGIVSMAIYKTKESMTPKKSIILAGSIGALAAGTAIKKAYYPRPEASNPAIRIAKNTYQKLAKK